MKKYIFVFSLLATLFVTSCEKDLPLYDDQQARLNFRYTTPGSTVTNLGDSIVGYSFVYNSHLTQDTVWLQLRTSGFLSSVDRPFELKQVETGENDAVPGVHYVSFDDPEYKQKYLVVKADSIDVTVPVILLKDASLNDATYSLRIEVKDNEYFKSGYKELKYKRINFTNQLVKPTYWNFLMNYYMGSYGKVKHQFMIDNTKYKWDDDYLKSIGVHNSSVDQTFLIYIGNKLYKLLNELNAQRAAQGLPDLQEEDGTFVTFPQ